MGALTPAQCYEYRKRGLLHLRDALPAGLIEALTAALEREVEPRARALYATGEISDLWRMRPLRPALVPRIKPARGLFPALPRSNETVILLSCVAAPWLAQRSGKPRYCRKRAGGRS